MLGPLGLLYTGHVKTKRMSQRILVITELFLPTKGGTAVWFDEVYRRMGGKEIHIVTADVPGAAEHDIDHANSIHRVSLRRHWWLRPESLGMYLKLLGKCLLLCAHNRFDAVHAGRVLPEGLIGWLVSRVIRRPLVTYAHGEEITSWGRASKFQAMKFTFRHSDCVIANSEYTRDEVIKLGVLPDTIRLIYPGVDIQRFRPGLETADLRASIKLQNDEKLILSVGRLSRRKGFDHVIRSLATLAEQGLKPRYAIIGIGEDREYLLALAEEFKMQDRVHLLGHVAPNDLPRWYNLCDVFAMPNREIEGDTEGFGMVFLEAAACGKPSIAGKAGGTGSAVAHERTGLRVDGASSTHIAEALMRILSDIELCATMGAAAQARAENEFSWELIAEKTQHIFPYRSE
jgi:phosphatidylinositol alpha-1,6-mannosyltransferase